MRKEDFFLLAQKYLDGKATEKEKQQLNEWYDSFDDAGVHIPAEADETEGSLEAKMLSRLKESLQNEPAGVHHGKTFVLRRNWMVAAAMLCILLSGAYFIFMKDGKNTSSVDGRMPIAMDDGDEDEKEEMTQDMYDHPREAARFQWLRTRDLSTGKVPMDKMWEAVVQTRQTKEIVSNSQNVTDVLSWVERGPDRDVVGPSNGNTRANNGVTSGRIDAIWVDLADATGKTVWIGGDAGGVWKTTDITASPATWTKVNDFFGNLYVSAITQDPTNHNIMYFSTGEAYYGGENGIGVFKSTDHGVTWNLLPSTTSFIFSSKMLCDPAGNVYLATRGNGLQRSTDKGATWTDITPSGVNNRICDLELSSTGRLHMVAGISGTAQTYRFTDVPATVTAAAGWTTPTTTFTSGTERAEIGVSGNTLYALPSIGNQVPTIWKSTDGGANWATSGTPPTMSTGQSFTNGQGFYDLAVAVNPANPNECVIGGVENAKTTNGGASWSRLSTWVGLTGQYVHADQHTSVWYDNGNKLLFGCDGGIHFSSDGGTTIRDRNVGLSLKEFYSVAIHPSSTNYMLGGTQDNGTHQLNGPGLTSSVEVTGGDGGYVAIDNDEPQFQVATYVFNNFRRSANGGANWSQGPSNNTGQFINPYDYDNANDRVYAATSAGQYLRWDNPQSGFTYTNVSLAALNGGSVASVFVSPFTANRVFFGTTNGTLARADNAETGSPAGTTLSTGSGMPAGYLNCINAGSTEQNLVVTFTNYNINNVWVSTNGGTSWTAIDGNLPNMPVYWAMFHPDDDTKMIIATETGVWETDQINGASTVWTTSPSIPTGRFTMLDYRASDRTLAAAGYGRGIWTTTIPPVISTGFDFSTPAPATAACPAPAFMDITLGTTSIGGFSGTVTLSAAGNPAGTTVSFQPANTVTPGNSVTVRLNGTNTLAAGSYTVTITGTATGAPTRTRELTYTVTAGTGPAFTVHPASQTVCSGGNVIFTAAAATATSFQWQLNNGAGFTNIPVGAPYSGTTTNTLTITGATPALSGVQYRCVASTICGSSNSNAATLTVNTAPSISAHPQSVTLCAGSSNTFSVTAAGTGLTYQWQISTTAVPAFTNIPSATSSSHTVTGITAGMNGDKYRVIVSGTCPSPATSNEAVLTVVTSVTVTTQPTNATVCDGANASFTVAGSGAGIIYQWQVNTGSGFTNVPAAAPYSGTTSATLNITGATTAMNGYQYRCQLSNATCTTPGVSNPATLTVNSLPSITAHPQSATVCVGGSNTFSVTAPGVGLTYQWQISTPAVPAFTNIPSATSATYTVTGITAAMNNNQYRVIVGGVCPPPATSNAATLTVITPVSVTTQPANVEQCSGANATFSVTGNSTQPISYQWQVNTDGVNWNNIAGATSSSYTVNNLAVVMNGNRYRVQLSNTTCTSPTTSAEATLTVRQLPTVNLTAAPYTSLLPPQTTTLTATPTASTGGVLTTTWTRNGGPIAVTGNSLAVTVATLGAYQVSIRETWPSSLFCSNLSPIVTIDANVSDRLFIYPTPNDGRFTVSYYNNGGAATSRMVTVFDSKGAKVYHAKFAIAGPYTLLPIDLRPALTGIYYVVVGDASGKVMADGRVLVH